MSSFLTVSPEKISERSFVDGAKHRNGLPEIYNTYSFEKHDLWWDPKIEDLMPILRPLYATSWLIDDFLKDNSHFGA
jgi:hypothetical protein